MAEYWVLKWCLLAVLVGCSSSGPPQQPPADVPPEVEEGVPDQDGGEPSALPRFDLADLEYQGAFRLPAGEYGESELNYSEGPLEYNPDHHSIFIVGHSHHQAIAEFDVPAVVNSTVLSELEMAPPPRQPFVRVLERAADGNPQAIDRIGGMEYVNGPNGPELLVNGYEYYDAPADDTDTTLVVRQADDLASSAIDGFYGFVGEAHTSSWISPIPDELQAELGGTHITGSSSGMPIIGRLSVGPSAFAFDVFDLVGTETVASPIATTTLLDFNLDHPLREDLYNESGENDLWTHLSRAVYGFIPPGTRTYFTFGVTGGHQSGVCYKCVPSGSTTECPGYCANDTSDYQVYYWLWDVSDLMAVRQGRLEPYAVLPYDYGELSVPFGVSEVGGGSFDPGTGRLYITLQRADLEQGEFSNPPVVAVYRVAVPEARDPASDP